MALSELRKQAYNYITEKLAALPVESESDQNLYIPLEDLRLLKEGKANPSAELMSSLRCLFENIIGDNELEIHLVAPFAEVRETEEEEAK
jgi:hypothetical protein